MNAAVSDATAGRPADRRPLAVGLIGALGQLPTVFSADEAWRHRVELYHLIHDGFRPFAGWHG